MAGTDLKSVQTDGQARAHKKLYLVSWILSLVMKCKLFLLLITDLGLLFIYYQREWPFQFTL